MIDTLALLHHIGCDPASPLAEPQPCPFHTDSSTLVLTPETSGMLFSCSVCGFELNAIGLLARYRGVSVDQLLADVIANGDSSNIFADDTPESYLQDYRKRLRSQEIVEAYFNRCVEAMWTTPQGSMCRDYLANRNIRLRESHPDVGILIPDAPRSVDSLSRNYLLSEPNIVFAYRRAAEIRKISAVRFDTGERVSASLAGADGTETFCEGDHSYGAESTIIAPDEFHALRLRDSLRAYSSHAFSSVIAMSGLGLGRKFAGVKHIYALDAESPRLDVRRALALHRSPEVGGENASVVDLRSCSYEVTTQFQALISKAQPLMQWASRRLVEVFDESGVVGLRSVFVDIPGAVDLELTQALESYCGRDDVVEALSGETMHRDHIVLADNAVISREPHGVYYTQTPKSTPALIMNFGLHVDCILRRSNGDRVYRITISFKDYPPETLDVPYASTRTPTFFAEAVRMHFMRKNAIIPVRLRARATYLPEILDEFAIRDRAAIVDEVEVMGWDSTGSLEFPGFSLNPGCDILSQQSRIYKLRSNAVALYGGVRPFMDNGAGSGSFKNLWLSTDSGKAVMIALISNLLYNLVWQRACLKNGYGNNARHMGLIDNPGSVFDPIVSNYHELFCGKKCAVALTPSLPVLRILGPLPYLWQTEDSRAVARLLRNREFAIAVVAEAEIIRANRKHLSTIIGIDNTAMELPRPLDSATVDGLRNELPWFVAEIMRVVDIPMHELEHIQQPAIAFAGVVARVLEVPVNAAVAAFGSAGDSQTPDLMLRFFDAMRRYFYKQKWSKLETSAPGSGPRARGYVLNGCVFVDRAVVDDVSRGSLTCRKLDSSLAGMEMHIDRHLQQGNHLVPARKQDPELALTFPGDRYWAIRHESWLEFVNPVTSDPGHRISAPAALRLLG